MDVDLLRAVVVVMVVATYIYTALLKQLIVVLMMTAKEKQPLDKALMGNQQMLSLQAWLWAATLLWFSGDRAARPEIWYVAWIVVTAAVAVTATWVLVGLWRERLRPLLAGWRRPVVGRRDG